MLRGSFLGVAAWPTLGATSRTYASGNKVAVILDRRGLREDQLLPIAREMNYSETAFVYPQAQSPLANPVNVRMFTRDGDGDPQPARKHDTVCNSA